MDKKCSFPCSSILPEELLIDILLRLPLESLHRLKWVSESSWYPLITDHVLPRLIPRPMGFFFSSLGRVNFHGLPKQQQQPPHSDPSLSFLPTPFNYRALVDSRNGLLLVSRDYNRLPPSHCCYLVCNPSTSSWSEIPAIARPPDARSILFSGFPCPYRECIILDFDPYGVHPHYGIIAIFFPSWCRIKRIIPLTAGYSPSSSKGRAGGRGSTNRAIIIYIYRSETRRWAREVVDLGGRRFVYPASGDPQHRVVWKGAAYVLSYSKDSSSCMITRFTLSGGGGVDGGLEFIELPEGLEIDKRRISLYGTCMGTLGDKLFLMNLDPRLMRMRVWSLSFDHEWAMEHESTLTPLMREYKEGDPLHIVSFHPAIEVVVILHRPMVLFRYDLKKMTLEDRLPITTLSSHSPLPTVFPFWPCSLDLLENRNQHH